jgi:signal transduction histidine kinase
MKWTFGNEIFLILIFFGLLPLSIFSFYNYSLSSYFLKDTIFSNLEEITRLLTKETEDFISSAFNDIKVLSENPILKSSKISLEEKSKELNKIVKYYPRFQDITFVDEYGNTLCSTSFRFYGKWQTNAWFQKAKEEKKIVMSEIYAISDPKNPILSFFAPVFDEQGKFSFLMTVQINMERFFEIFDRVKVGKEGYAFLINSRGDIISHLNREFLFDKISPNYPLKEAFEKKEGRIEFNFKNTDFVGTFRNVILNQNKAETPKWQIIVIEPKKEAFVLLNSLKSQIYFLILIFFVFLIFFSKFLSKIISQPLKELILATEKIARGNFDVQIDIKRTDEFGELAKSFIQMAKRLSESYIALEQGKEREMILRIRERARIEETERKVKELEEARIALMSILEDVEEARKKAEEEKNKTLAIVENFVDGLLIFDKDRRLVSMNPQAEIFLKLKKEEIIEKSIEDLKEIPEFKKIFEIVGPEIQPCFREEIQMEENLILEVTSLPILLEKEKIGNLIILHDITREKYIDQLKTEFVSLAAHQLRTPLSGIKWSLKMILDEDLGPVPEGLKDFLKKALLSNERLIHLVNDLLDVTRIEEGKFLYKLEEKDVAKIVEDVFNSYLDLAKEKNIEFKLEKLKDDFPLVKVDEEKIKLVIQNLIENALIYTLPKGKVTVTIDLQNGNFFFKIQDTGIGIPKEVRDRIFTKFFRAPNAAKIDTEGSGLGLFVTKNIVESHGGKIWFESEEGKGTTFYFTIPVKKRIKK